MKKIISLILCLVFVLSSATLSACKKDEFDYSAKTPYEKISQSVKNTRKLDGLDCEVDTIITLSGGISRTQGKSKFKIKVNGFSSKSPEYSGSFSADNDGIRDKGSFYYKDDYVYVKKEGSRDKYHESHEKAQDYLVIDTIKVMLEEIPEEYFEDAQIDGNTYTFKFDSDVFREIYADFHEIFTESLKEFGRLSYAKYSPVVTIKIKNGYVSEYNIKFHANYNVIKDNVRITMNTSFDSTLKINAPGKNVSVDIPQDLDEYWEN